ncbi:MAG: restriction endonuclease subunit S [Mycolicibacter arupensis]|uniref:Restriction endonuclease subunit S n=2 Tax=Mycolicibacter arupensis TaxID=342002 RepID=A0A5C7XP28_9MYCO|nr:restriction endonuclease subunit S [Mycolicibacter arupensis]TXI51150.1 MAG: restriction endonuclease subunit S [Mycolicibacter arupensis]
MKMVPLGEVTTPVGTWNPARDADSEFRYIDLSAVDNTAKCITGATALVAQNAPSRARQLVTAGDVLVSTVRPNLNAVAAVTDCFNGATASTGFTVLRPSAQLDSRYLFNWVQTQRFVSDMVRKATGASYPAVSDRVVKDSAIPLPPLAEQRRIAAILDHADALRAKRRQAIRHLKDLTQSIFRDMFGRDRFPTAPLSEVVQPGTIVTYGIVQAGPEYEGGIPYIRTGDIDDGEIQIAKLRHTDPDIAARFERSKLSAGDIVMSIRATVGTTALVSTSLEGANLTQGTARLSPSDIATGPYLLNFLRSDLAQRWIQSQVKGVTFREITLGRLRQLPVPLPPLEIQEEFARRSAIASANLQTANKGERLADTLFASLQSRAFRGEL